jgi:hypothetical protein
MIIILLTLANADGIDTYLKRMDYWSQFLLHCYLYLVLYLSSPPCGRQDVQGTDVRDADGRALSVREPLGLKAHRAVVHDKQ